MVEAYLNGSSDVTFYDLDIYNSPIIKCRRIISNYVGMAPGFLIHVHTSSLFCSIEDQCYLWYHFIIEHHICICLYDFKHAVQNHNSNVLIHTWSYGVMCALHFSSTGFFSKYEQYWNSFSNTCFCWTYKRYV